jgi:hypothetical protein
MTYTKKLYMTQTRIVTPYRTEPSTRQGGRPMTNINLPEEANIWPWVPFRGSQPRLTDWQQQHACLPACLPARPPACLPACLPIRSLMKYAWPVWSHVRKLQMLQSKCLLIATNPPWYVGNRQIHEDLEIPFLKVIWCWESLTSVTCKAPTSSKDCLKSLTVNRRGRMYSRPVGATLKRRPSRRDVQYPTLLGYPDWSFPCFSSVVRQMPGYKWKGARPAYTRSWRPSA